MFHESNDHMSGAPWYKDHSSRAPGRGEWIRGREALQDRGEQHDVERQGEAAQRLDRQPGSRGRASEKQIRCRGDRDGTLSRVVVAVAYRAATRLPSCGLGIICRSAADAVLGERPRKLGRERVASPPYLPAFTGLAGSSEFRALAAREE